MGPRSEVPALLGEGKDMLGGGNLTSFLSHSGQTICAFDLAGFASPSLSSLAMVGNAASVGDVNIEP